MAPSSALLSVLLLAIILKSAQLGESKPPSFCPLTLSRPTCPDLPTYDAFDITTYGGRWFEIGSTANFKNLQESGGICVIANYTLQQPPFVGNGAIVGVVNTLYSLGGTSSNVSQIVISLTSGQICSQAFSICTETELGNSSNSSFSQGLALLSNVASKCPSQTKALESAAGKIERTIGNIDRSLDDLSKDVTAIQELDAKLGQGQGIAADNLAALIGTVAEANATIADIAKSVGKIEAANESIGKLAAQLAAEGDGADSAALFEAVALFSAGGSAIAAQLAGIQASLVSVVGIAPLFLVPDTAPKGYNGRIVGVADQNASFAGKLEVTFPGFPLGQYWVLAVEEGGPDGGYAATLVYGCDENISSSGGEGGIEETLFILSRTPTLPDASVNSLLSTAAALGVTGVCSTPFIFTVQDPRCGNPPSDIPAYYYR